LNCAGLCPITEGACSENVSAPGVAQISVKAGFIRKVKIQLKQADLISRGQPVNLAKVAF